MAHIFVVTKGNWCVINSIIDNKLALATFNGYLRDRMDYLADISTATPLMEVSKYLNAEVIGGIDRNRILLNHISGLDHFSFTIQLVDGRQYDHAGMKGQQKSILQITGDDIQVSIPNDIMGCHALYVIIENLIRNTAKHGQHLDEDIVYFTLELRECERDSELYELWVYDNVERMRPVTKDQKESFQRTTGTIAGDDLYEIDWLVASQNKRLDQPIIDPDTNQLRQGAWGLIEMKASAGYLRRIPIEDIDNDSYLIGNNGRGINSDSTLPILSAQNVDGCLGYVFHLRKPKEILIVDEIGDFYRDLIDTQSQAKDQKSKLEELFDKGIHVLAEEEWGKNEVRAGNHANTHALLLVIAKAGFKKELYQENNGLFRGDQPSRIMVVMPSNGATPADCDAKFLNPGFLQKLKELPVERIFYRGSDDLHKLNWSDFIWQTWLRECGISKRVGGFSPSLPRQINIPKSPVGAMLHNYAASLKDSSDRGNRMVSLWVDHHGSSISDFFEKVETGTFCFVNHYEAYPSSLEDLVKAKLRDKDASGAPNPDFDKKLLFRLGAAILQKVLILDERIQSEYQKEFAAEGGDKILKKNLFEAAGVFIPSASLDLNAKHYPTYYIQGLEGEIKEIANRGFFTGIDMIVIHLGVIERLLIASGKQKSSTDVKHFIRWLTSISKARVVVTSGRGKPDNLPTEAPFLAYSSLSQYAIEKPFKAFLVEAIRAARIFKN